uniref:Reverse transcriptase domain-containing protein n=1 Tax=Tanacetum cinerariifolium TaxID=118510 RepID=A0A6L2KSV6_TANCI|nr:hypothetical protein [Tanacetum cinerariifolium]
MEESLSKFTNESTKRHEENSNLIKEIQAFTDAAIRNQGASIKTLEIQIGKMSKVLRKRGFGSLPSYTETNPRDHVKAILTTVETETTPMPRIVWTATLGHLFILSYSLQRFPTSKEKDPGSFTLPCYINNIYFENALADLGASPIIEEGEVVDKPVIEEVKTRNDDKMVSKIIGYPSGYEEDEKIRIDYAYNLKVSCMIVVEDMDPYLDKGI